jgi:hypothetical protein
MQIVINNSVLKAAEGPQNKMIRIGLRFLTPKKSDGGGELHDGSNTQYARGINDASAEVLAIIAR